MGTFTDSMELSGLEKAAYVTGVSPEMKPVQKLIAEIAPTDIPVLVVGESGTGKGVAAQQIHRLSKRRGLPFLTLGCAGQTEESFREQLHAFERAGVQGGGQGLGTVFFDVVSDLNPDCQRHLLHIFPASSETPQQEGIKARIISSASQGLDSEVHGGRFRSDLYYRLNGVCLRMPPLRRRREDIALLVELFLRKFAVLFGRKQMSLSAPAMLALSEYDWPGNIRELENVVKKMVVLESEELAIEDLKGRVAPPPADPGAPGNSLKAAARSASQQAERELILQTLERTHWNRKRAAEVLQVSYKALLYKLKQIQGPDSERM
ncbi:MAG: sigma 54-interacting transcriptional regulator [Acidobacteriia bacterium]|nr:sigma 54-interacting transcriptional regulator [Terriglobia bacterium]